MSKKDKAISDLTDMVISWQKMYNLTLKQMETMDGKKRFKILIPNKQEIIDGALGKYDE